MSLNALLQDLSQHHPDKVAIESDAGHLTYLQLSTLVNQCALYFTSLGLNPGDRIALLALNHPDWFIVIFAAARAGFTVVPLNWRLSLSELQFVVSDSEPSLLLFDDNFQDSVDALKQSDSITKIGTQFEKVGSGNFPQKTPLSAEVKSTRYPPDTEPLFIVYTSGTTGRPKGAVLFEKSILCSAAMSLHMLEFTHDDRVLNVLPLFHVGGLNIQPLPALINGSTVVLHDRFDPKKTMESLINDNITLITTVPTVLQAMLATSEWTTPGSLSLRAMSIGSTDVPTPLITAVQERGIPVLQIYGATETSPAAIYQQVIDADQVGSIGKAGSLCEIKLVNESGNEVAMGLSGEIWVRGDNILSHYWNDETATQISITDGWFHTGDVAHQDNNGYYWFDDRVKHVIISGGENIYPAELERLIQPVHGVTEVVVVGKSDQKWGEVPVAVVVGDADKQTVKNACSAIAKFKQPRDVIYVDALPRNAMGKVIVNEVKKLVEYH